MDSADVNAGSYSVVSINLACTGKLSHTAKAMLHSLTRSVTRCAAAASCTDVDTTVRPHGTATSAPTKPWHTLMNSGKLSLQAQHVGRIFSVADAALTELEPTTAVATVAAADALREVLQAQEQLTNHCSEASLTQLIAVVRDTSPELQRACWLLVTQQETYKSQARIC